MMIIIKDYYKYLINLTFQEGWRCEFDGWRNMESEKCLWFCVSSGHGWKDDAGGPDVCPSAYEYDYNRLYALLLQVRHIFIKFL